ncbi:MAG TPA: 16S rRNA (cytidine(1402)-2'-O)-methyltransferase, partial [Acidimicrobiales bacterium]|nr:16S rRNA (cytidine(1402)-2'-O)-methyltransferase [Acidimicrobiales bacterium]
MTAGRTGRLVLVATPIGNLGDLSPRAVATLAEADAVVCEDTRRTGRLLQHAGVSARRLVVANQHTEARAAAEVVRLLGQGRTVAVVTDAGTPGVSDPGERLVRAALAAGHQVEAVPGPSAALAALLVSGLPTDRFAIDGFLPRTGAARRERLAALRGEHRTVILYEAPHRLARTIDDLVARLGPDRRVVLARELTKLHEEVWRGTLGGARDWLAANEPRGEFVVVLAGAPPPPPATTADVVEALQATLAAGADQKTAVAEVAAALEVPR